MHLVPVRGDLQTPECPWRDLYAMGALQLQSVYWVRYSDENISLTRHQNIVLQSTWCFHGLHGVECNVRMRIHGKLSLCEIFTHISTIRMFARLRIDCMKYNV